MRVNLYFLKKSGIIDLQTIISNQLTQPFDWNCYIQQKTQTKNKRRGKDVSCFDGVVEMDVQNWEEKF